jgi:hypothetical protein
MAEASSIHPQTQLSWSLLVDLVGGWECLICPIAVAKESSPSGMLEQYGGGAHARPFRLKRQAGPRCKEADECIS